MVNSLLPRKVIEYQVRSGKVATNYVGGVGIGIKMITPANPARMTATTIP
jgi:hypothetical protein